MYVRKSSAGAHLNIRFVLFRMTAIFEFPCINWILYYYCINMVHNVGATHNSSGDCLLCYYFCNQSHPGHIDSRPRAGATLFCMVATYGLNIHVAFYMYFVRTTVSATCKYKYTRSYF